jgi:hypothetical protein
MNKNNQLTIAATKLINIITVVVVIKKLIKLKRKHKKRTIQMYTNLIISTFNKSKNNRRHKRKSFCPLKIHIPKTSQ